MGDPTLIRLDVETKLSANLKTAFFYTRSEDKMAALVHLLRRAVPANQQTLVFAATKHHVELIRETLTLAGFTCAFCYSALDQAARKIEIAKFRLKKADVMVVTDVAARGIDIPLLDNVVNFHFPPKGKVFVHRVGRVARAGSSGTAFSLVASDEFAYMMDLFLFLGRTLKFAKDNSRPEEDGLIGSVPRSVVDEEGDMLKRFSSDSSDIDNLVKVTTNAYKMYLKSRPPASTESSKRLKELNLATTSMAHHPLLLSNQGEDGKAAVDLSRMLAEMKQFRPQSTIFEVNKSKQSEAIDVMKQKRQTHDVILAKKRKKIDEVATAKDEAKDDAGDKDTQVDAVTGESVSDAVISAAFGANVIAPKNRSDAYFNKLEHEASKKKAKKESFKDEEFYVPSQSKDYHTEKGLEVAGSADSFELAAKGATMDLTMDDNEMMRHQKRQQTTQKRWDRKKMKFVGLNEKQVKSAKKVKNESGQWITASYKTDRYKKWKKMSKMESRMGEDDGENEGNERPTQSRQPPNVNPAMGFRKQWHTKNDKEKKLLLDGVKSKEVILKARLKKDAKKSYQLYRQRMNKKRRK